MKKGVTIATLIVLLFNFGYGQKLSKDDLKQIKAELKNYMKHPEQYKAKMDESQTNKDASDAQLVRLNADLKVAQADEADLQKKVAAGDDLAKLLQDENDNLKQTVAKYKDDDMKSAPPHGTVYKVQLGIYRGLNVNKSFEEPRYIGFEDVSGMNRYVISYFPDSLSAAKLVGDIRKLGIRDAFVAKYIDGVRVYEWNQNPKYRGKKVPETLEEAIDTKLVKKGKKSNTTE